MFFIANAYAQTLRPLNAGAESSLMSIGFMVLIFVVFYFLMIRPQVKRQKEHKSMVDALNKGDEVVTAGGIVGKITEIDDQFMTLQMAPSTASRSNCRCSGCRADAAAEGHRQVALDRRPAASDHATACRRAGPRPPEARSTLHVLQGARAS